MNETRTEKTNWTSLVCIKYDSNEIYNEQELCRNLIEQWHNYHDLKIVNIDDISHFGVQITDAGSLFAKILADFEYFACRFLSNEPPLFSIKNIKKIGGKFPAVEIINIIREKAFCCIDEVIEKDFEFFSDSGDNSNREPNFTQMYNNEYCWLYKDAINARSSVHPYRILTQHSGYLSNYISYVESYIPEESFDHPKDKAQLIDSVKEQLAQYNTKLNELISLYPNYFEK